MLKHGTLILSNAKKKVTIYSLDVSDPINEVGNPD